MHCSFFPKIYGSWQKKQLEKYRQLLPLLKKHLNQNCSVLDIGIGKGWLEEFLQKEGFVFPRVVGVDVLEERIEPRREGIEYVVAKNGFSTREKFGFVACFDSAHLLEENIALFAKPNALVLLSAPLSQKHRVPEVRGAQVLEKGVVGFGEKSFFKLLKASSQPL